jgi:hypothetical protein
MRLLAQARNPYSPSWLWIPGSLAQRKIDARINFVARLAPRNDGLKVSLIFSINPQYDFGKPSTFSAMKLRMNCGLTGAMRGIRDSRK